MERFHTSTEWTAQNSRRLESAFLRVIHVTPRYFPHIGGIESIVKELSERLVREDHSVSVYALDLNAKLPCEELVNGVLVRRYKPIVGDPFYLPSFGFLKAIQNDNADIVHIHNIHTLPVIFVALLKKPDQRMIIQPHYHRFAQTWIRNLFFTFYKRLLTYIALSRADAIIVNSRHEKKMVEEDFLRNRSVILIPEGIDVGELKSVEWSPVCSKRILYVGGLRKYKNIDKLLLAFSLLLNKENKDLKLVIIGGGPEKRRLVELAHKLGIESYVEWKHDLTRQKLLFEYAKARIFISLSSFESFGRAVHEAIAIGVPTIALNSGVTAELVQKGLAEGVSSVKPEEIAEVISKTLKRYKKLETENVLRYFVDWNEYFNELKKVYEGVTKC